MSSVGFSIGNSSAAVAVAKVFNVNVHPTTEKLETLHSRYMGPPIACGRASVHDAILRPCEAMRCSVLATDLSNFAKYTSSVHCPLHQTLWGSTCCTIQQQLLSLKCCCLFRCAHPLVCHTFDFERKQSVWLVLQLVPACLESMCTACVALIADGSNGTRAFRENFSSFVFSL